MIWLLIYAFCSVDYGCSQSKKEAYSSGSECQVALAKQEAAWKKKGFDKVGLTCLEVPGMGKDPEGDRLNPRIWGVR